MLTSTSLRDARVIAICLWLLQALPALAASPQTLAWKDLLPAASDETAFTALPKDQLALLSDIAAARDRMAAGETLTATERQDERAAVRTLEHAGVDVKGLLAKRKAILDQRRVQASSVKPSLDGQLIRIPGYMLPLDFKGKEVTEFLLVPWVGACIHTPPPPPNQIVHVKTQKAYLSTGMFAPVWVTGKISTSGSKTSLYLVDGTSNIDIGYTLNAIAVEAYKEEATQ
jgi:uncharacterized protein